MNEGRQQQKEKKCESKLKKKCKKEDRKEKNTKVITATISTKKNDCAYIKWQEVNLIICTIAIWLNVREQMQLLHNFVGCSFVGASALRLSIGIWNEMHSIVAMNVFWQMINFEWNVKQKSISLDLHNHCVCVSVCLCKLHLDVQHIHFKCTHPFLLLNYILYVIVTEKRSEHAQTFNLSTVIHHEKRSDKEKRL